MEGLIFDIKKYAIHDGPGIRTTIFFKGCPLYCPWCHNPEGIKKGLEIMVSPDRCIHCEQCVHACSKDALFRHNEVVSLDRQKCDLCGACLDVCYTRAIELVGRYVTVEQSVKEIEKDKVFYDQSGGGVTLSGGEPLMQAEFAGTLVRECKRRGIHTVLDTCGYADLDVLRAVSGFVDLYLFDVKIMDEKKHRYFTGVSNEQILSNLQALSRSGKALHVRIPVIPGITDDDENIQAASTFLASLQHVEKVSLLPYHRAWLTKYYKITNEKEPYIAEPPSAEILASIQKVFKSRGLDTTIGG
jgi:pyruvate formate lyase activating enzyme